MYPDAPEYKTITMIMFYVPWFFLYVYFAEKNIFVVAVVAVFVMFSSVFSFIFIQGISPQPLTSLCPLYSST